MQNNNSIQVKIIIILALLIVIFLGYITLNTKSKSIRPESTFIITEVIQNKNNLDGPFSFKNTTIIPKANFQVTGRILSRKKYYIGKESKLSPIDFAMGWGAMARDDVISKIKISQHNRWYYWNAKKYPIPRREIEKHSANMHMIPANEMIHKEMMKANAGSIVKFSGYLVRVVADNWTWQSSLTRNDTGNHACEVVFVKEFEILN